MGRAERDGQSTSRISRRKFPLDLFSTHLIGLQEVNQARRMVDGELEEGQELVTGIKDKVNE